MRTREDVAPFLDAFHAIGIGDNEPSWLTTHRSTAMERFAELGVPGRDLEAWRFTDLRLLTANPIVPVAVASGAFDATALEPYKLPARAHRLVLVNGRFEPALSQIGELPPGAWIGSTAEALTTRPELVRQVGLDSVDTTGAQAFMSLNAGLFTDGFILALEPGVALETPVEILHFADASDANAFHMRNAIVLGASATASVVETFAGSGSGWTNTVTKIQLAESARLRHVKIQVEAPEAFHISMLRASLAARAAYEVFTATLGARLSRQDMQIDLEGEGADLALHGTYLLRGDQEATLAPFVNHRVQNCHTSEVLKGVLDERAHGVFLGLITVSPGADGTEAHQLNRNLLLSPNARVDTKPELEIYADDVKCSHGATVGDLDEASLFYLLARGIEPATARHMLIEAFVGDLVETAGLEGALAEHARKHISTWFDRPEAA